MEVLPSVDGDDKDATLLSVTSRGYGKRTVLSEYRSQGRGGSGIINVKTNDKIGVLVGVKKVYPGEDLMVISNVGQLIRTPASSVSEMGRNTQGVKVLSLDESELVQAIAIIRDVDVEVDASSQAIH